MGAFGYGAIHLISNSPVGGQRQLFAGPYSSISIATEVESAEAKGYIDGKLKTTSSAITSENSTLTLQYQELDRRGLELMMQTRAVTTASLPLPRGATVIVPSAPPYTVSVPGVAVGSLVFAVVQGKFADLVPAADMTLGADQITFTAAYAGKSMFIQRTQTYSNVITIGLSNIAESLDVDYTFFTQVYGPNFPNGLFICAPKASFISKPSFESGDVAELEIQMKLGVPAGAPGPFYWAELPPV